MVFGIIFLMGVIRPPWISKEWFAQCPFNYCDHFGNKELLATVCKICKGELQRKELYRKAGKDPYAWENVFKDIADDLGEAMAMLYKQAEEMGINLDEIPDDDYEEPSSSDQYPIFRLVRIYGDQVEHIMKSLEVIPHDADLELVEKALDALSHSRTYVIAKIGRALSSRWREERDSFMKEVADSKTSAFFTYIAIERNSKAMMALAKHKLLRELKEKHLRFAAVSLEVAEMIRQEFFPNDKLVYKEFGYEDF